jgi:hypothetical protein
VYKRQGTVTIEDNSLIAGGDSTSTALSGGKTVGYGAYGVFVSANAPVVSTLIKNNQQIRGCFNACLGKGDKELAADRSPATAAGLRLEIGTHEVEGNEVIVGGNWSGADDNSFTHHVGIYGSSGLCLTEEANLCFPGTVGPVLTLRNNKLVMGSGYVSGENPKAPAKRPRYAYGLLTTKGSVKVEGGRYFGGWTEELPLVLSDRHSTTVGAYVLQGSSVEVSDARLSAGSAKTAFGHPGVGMGLVVSNSAGVRVERNWVDGCGLENATTPNLDLVCESYISQGVVSVGNKGALLGNNYVFSGLGAVASACVMGPSEEGDKLLYNACLVQPSVYNSNLSDEAAALNLSSFGGNKVPNGIVVENNILGILDREKGERIMISEKGLKDTLTDYTVRNNAFFTLPVAGGPPIVTYWYRRTGGGSYTELDTIADVNTLGGANMAVSFNGLFLAPAPLQPNPTGFHMSNFCNLAQKGIVNELITEDYDKQARSKKPTIGPDECP